MIPRRTPKEIELIRACGQIVSQVQQLLEATVAPGITPRILDTLAEETIHAAGATPAFKGYRGFPSSICASVNAETVHCVPSDRPLRDGDIISIDVGVQREGFYGDGAFTIAIGHIAPERQRLLETTLSCLDLGIAQARAGHRLSDISHAIQCAAKAEGLAVVRGYGGHGIGHHLHEPPHIPNEGAPGRGLHLQPGHVFAIEPILSLGSPEINTLPDGWTTTTQDGAPTAHFEHTVAITTDAPDILTSPAGVTDSRCR